MHVHDLTYVEYCRLLDAKEQELAIFGLEKLAFLFRGLRSTAKDIADKLGTDVKDVVRALKHPSIFKLLKAIKFDLMKLLAGMKKADALIQGGLLRVFARIEKSGAIQQLRKGALRIDDFLNRYPILKKLAGVAFAGLLFYIWINMSFIGHPGIDLNLSDMTDALFGKFSVTDLFLSDSGLLMLTLLATGMLTGISFPWLSHSHLNLIIALCYTTYVKTGRSNLANKFKRHILMTRKIKVLNHSHIKKLTIAALPPRLDDEHQLRVLNKLHKMLHPAVKCKVDSNKLHLICKINPAPELAKLGWKVQDTQLHSSDGVSRTIWSHGKAPPILLMSKNDTYIMRIHFKSYDSSLRNHYFWNEKE